MPENHLLVIWLYYFSFAKYDLAKFGSVMKQKGLIYQFLRFWVVKTFLKSYGSFFNYIGEG